MGPIAQVSLDVKTLDEGALAAELEVEDPETLPRHCGESFVYLRDLVTEVTGHLPG